MGNSYILSEDQQDCLQELINIAYGSGTAAITEILDAFATLSIPKISIIETSELKEYLSKQVHVDTPQFIATQLVNGKFSSENLFIIDKNSAMNLATEFGLNNEEIQNPEELSDIILEITNILSSSTISKFAKEMGMDVSFSPPYVKLLESLEEMDNNFIDKYQKVIIISTMLNFQNQNINGELLILTTDETIEYIKELIDKILNEL
ncbi:MAG: chemotaxis protein CheC [Candidatus Marinarcus sp.]|uniref:chemotaxis protein CheC n=1 Tax=Candidatus Marinarcus sp. TaxID=3100987 RepID=UPI003B0020D1